MNPAAGPALAGVGRGHFWCPFGELVSKSAVLQHLSAPVIKIAIKSEVCGVAPPTKCGQIGPPQTEVAPPVVVTVANTPPQGAP